MKKEDKGIVVERLAETLKAYGNFYLTDIVVKNTLFKKALESMDTDYSALYETLKGNTAVMFSNVVNAPARLMKDFTKGMKGEVKPQLKAAYVQESFYIGAENLDALVNLKSREEMIGDVIGLLQSPIKNVMSALQSSSGQAIHGILQTLEKR